MTEELIQTKPPEVMETKNGVQIKTDHAIWVVRKTGNQRYPYSIRGISKYDDIDTFWDARIGAPGEKMSVRFAHLEGLGAQRHILLDHSQFIHPNVATRMEFIGLDRDEKDPDEGGSKWNVALTSIPIDTGFKGNQLRKELSKHGMEDLPDLLAKSHAVRQAGSIS